EGSPPGAESLDVRLEPFRSTRGKLGIWYLVTANYSRVVLETSHLASIPEPPYFVTADQLTTPQRVTLRGDVTSELAENPDVRAYVAWDETKISLDRYDDMLKCGQPDRGLAYPRGC